MGITVGGDCRDLSNLSAGGDVFLVLLEIIDHGLNSSLSASSQIHRVAAGGHILDGFGEDGRGKDGGGGSTVTSDFVCLGSNVLDQASTEVFKFILENNSFCYRDTIYAKSKLAIEQMEQAEDDEPFVILGEP